MSEQGASPLPDEELASLRERVEEAEAQCREYGEMFIRQSGLIRDLYALLDKIEAAAKQAHWEGQAIAPSLIRALLKEKPDERDRLAKPEYRKAQTR